MTLDYLYEAVGLIKVEEKMTGGDWKAFRQSFCHLLELLYIVGGAISFRVSECMNMSLDEMKAMSGIGISSKRYGHMQQILKTATGLENVDVSEIGIGLGPKAHMTCVAT